MSAIPALTVGELFEELREIIRAHENGRDLQVMHWSDEWNTWMPITEITVEKYSEEFIDYNAGYTLAHPGKKEPIDICGLI